MQMSPINLDYKNILMSESTKIAGKSKKRNKTDGIEGRKEHKFCPRPGNSSKHFARWPGLDDC